MGQGLSKNSPVKLTLNKSNYEALISRHGQWIRWRSSFKCSCVSMPTMQPDPKCKICKGRGVTYTYQKSQVVHSLSILYNNNGIIDIEDEYKDCDLIEVYDYNGRRYRNATKNGQYVSLNESNLPVKGTYFYVVLRQDNEKTLDIVIPNQETMGYYSIPGITSRRPNVEGIYYEAQPDIIGIDSIVDANGIVYEPEEFRLNKFRISPKTEVIEEDGEENEVEIPIEEPLTVKGVHYVPPFIFAVLQQNLSKGDAEALTEMKGDAICLFPYNCDVAEDDILTVMAGSFVYKEVMPRSDFETDTLANYFVYDIISVTGLINGNIVNYKEGKDFVLVGTNKIKWLDDTSENTPDTGDSYSISYHVLPTYKVVKEIPQLRTSENQRFPKKAVIKLHATYSEAVGANKQVVNRRATEGSY